MRMSIKPKKQQATGPAAAGPFFKKWRETMLIYPMFADMLQQPHLLIAGATGSGKSVIVNNLIYTGLRSGPDRFQLILVDPKRVELVQYRDLPHCIYYASEPGLMIHALQIAMDITEKRYKEMQQKREKKYSGPDLYIIIDELADLMTTNKKAVQPLLQRLCQIGRAAKVHVIACTQCPLSAVIPTPIKVNFDARVGLRTRSKQDSRNIMDFTGLETLPRYGQCIYMNPEKTVKYNVPMIPETEINAIIRYWTQSKIPRKKKKWILF